MKKVIAYLDILGFKNIVTEWKINEEISIKLNNAFKNSIDWVGGSEALTKEVKDAWNLRIFSDSVIIFQELTSFNIYTTIKGISHFIRELIAEGFLLRGAITLGEYKETEFTTFSDGLVEAYELESKTAIFPRVIISDLLIEFIDSINDSEIRKTIKEYIIIDTSNIKFLCHFIFEEDDPWFADEKFYKLQKSIIENNIKKYSNNQKILKKYTWLADFHNWTIALTSEVIRHAEILNEDNSIDFKGLLIKDVNIKNIFNSLLWFDPDFPIVDKRKLIIPIDDILKNWPYDHFDEDGRDYHNDTEEDYYS